MLWTCQNDQIVQEGIHLYFKTSMATCYELSYINIYSLYKLTYMEVFL